MVEIQIILLSKKQLIGNQKCHSKGLEVTYNWIEAQVQEEKLKNSLSIILPTFNEVKSLEYVVNGWHTFLKNQNIDYVFIIYEDGSTDGTKELIKNMEGSMP